MDRRRPLQGPARPLRRCRGERLRWRQPDARARRRGLRRRQPAGLRLFAARQAAPHDRQERRAPLSGRFEAERWETSSPSASGPTASRFGSKTWPPVFNGLPAGRWTASSSGSGLPARSTFSRRDQPRLAQRIDHGSRRLQRRPGHLRLPDRSGGQNMAAVLALRVQLGRHVPGRRALSHDHGGNPLKGKRWPVFHYSHFAPLVAFGGRTYAIDSDGNDYGVIYILPPSEKPRPVAMVSYHRAEKTGWQNPYDLRSGPQQLVHLGRPQRRRADVDGRNHLHGEPAGHGAKRPRL